LLAQSGEFGLVLFAYASDAALLEPALFQQLLVVVVLSMFVTPPLAHLAQHLAATRARPPVEQEEEPDFAPVVLAGFGRVGRRIGKVLTEANLPYVAIDNNASLVLEQRANGFPVFYGDGRRPDVLRSIGIADARCVIVIIDDFEASESIVAALHEAHPHLEILARGHDATQCRRLRNLGATVAVSENLEASVELARAVLLHEGISASRGETLLRDFRNEYYADVDKIS
jgi:voltage-gated potassium channel Kch